MRKTVLALTQTLSVLAAVFTLTTQTHAQVLCNDPNSCNFGSVWEECFYGLWVRPFATSSGNAAIYECLGLLPSGYVYANQDCMVEVISNDPFCVNSSWDSVCDTAYLECCPDQNIWIPDVMLNGYQGLSAIIPCGSPPPGYILTDQNTLWNVIGGYPQCFSSAWSIGCQNTFNNFAFGCPDVSYYIPIDVNSNGALFFGCETPSSGYYNANDACVMETFMNDFFCIDTVWDAFCQEAYEQCTGCASNAWIPFVPYQDQVAVVFDACDPPGSISFSADLACVAEVIAADSQCAAYWDLDCWGQYYECEGFCSTLSYFFSYSSSGVEFSFTCSDSNLANSIEVAYPDCAVEVISTNTNCAFSWDSQCQQLYEDCVGCALLWYYPIGTDQVPAVQGCSDIDGYALGHPPCMDIIALEMSYCLTSVWNEACMQAHNDCYFGCRYSHACNYSVNAGFDDGSCVFPGCTDQTALNYEPMAGCDNGSCILPQTSTCTGDLNNDQVVNATDLLLFLANFGLNCLPAGG
jgi:hypothetical protein